MVDYYAKELEINLDEASNIGPSKGLCFVFTDDDDVAWYNMVLPEGIPVKTIVHECSHAIDFIMDDVGVPINVDNTEIRAYLLAELFSDAMKVVEGRVEK